MKKTIFAEKAPAAVGPYVHAVEAGNMVFTSGQLGLDPENGTLPEGIEAQTHQALKNLGAVLEAAGVGYEDVVLYFGMMIDAMMYARIPDPPIKEKITHASLTSVGSMLKYSPIPPQTPQII